ncbi:hypothetical protein RRG08_016751 [Elysia crispata]|uniref:Uncharacterized protein n=1 Tax=Elysia crispata TaxID=231223 RepID=A0AAE0ZXS5_9GAST|nr:hypothetical protein RRG08_016751 [Elysia crispata]
MSSLLYGPAGDKIDTAVVTLDHLVDRPTGDKIDTAVVTLDHLVDRPTGYTAIFLTELFRIVYTMSCAARFFLFSRNDKILKLVILRGI